MKRLIIKYERFIRLMSVDAGKIVVPTLDVDLAWHTHQLSPRSYYDFTVAKTQKFVDHDDKINEDKLTAAFEWTSKTYQEYYGEVYSECTCWYCESIRTSHVSSVGKLLGVSKNEKSKDPICRAHRPCRSNPFYTCELTNIISLQRFPRFGPRQALPTGCLGAHLVT